MSVETQGQMLLHCTVGDDANRSYKHKVRPSGLGVVTALMSDVNKQTTHEVKVQLVSIGFR